MRWMSVQHFHFFPKLRRVLFQKSEDQRLNTTYLDITMFKEQSRDSRTQVDSKHESTETGYFKKVRIIFHTPEVFEFSF